MAVYDLEEQEQIDEFKAWWKQYRGLIFLVIAVALLTAAAIQGWRYFSSKQTFEAGELYTQLQGAAAGGDSKRVRDIAAVLVEKYPRTGFATFAALAAAKAAFESGESGTAATLLRWAVDKGRDDPTREIARLRLAGVLLDEGKHDEALKLLAEQHSESMTALYADLKGDVLVAAGKPAEARAAYQLALDRSEARSAYRALVQMKLDALGAAK